MTDSMVERVARAIAAKSFERPWETLSPNHGQADMLRLARAAIEAMREPTILMRRKGVKAWVKAIDQNKPLGKCAEDCLSAMIDAALKE